MLVVVNAVEVGPVITAVAGAREVDEAGERRDLHVPVRVQVITRPTQHQPSSKRTMSKVDRFVCGCRTKKGPIRGRERGSKRFEQLRRQQSIDDLRVEMEPGVTRLFRSVRCPYGIEIGLDLVRNLECLGRRHGFQESRVCFSRQQIADHHVRPGICYDSSTGYRTANVVS